MSEKPCCCGAADERTLPEAATLRAAHWVLGEVATPVGPISQVATTLDFADRTGTVKARLGSGRMRYDLPPGLYAVGSPSADSPVFVSANYKMSFDCLRRALPKRLVAILLQPALPVRPVDRRQAGHLGLGKEEACVRHAQRLEEPLP